ncbi:WD40-repeat-containing domain protein [Radiomyces spectabilis]|uniref:WD40-repeat-containing domain protein n=1 Tax=Radiomyces spectabilis TaxID=64574 RepID=UPI00221FF356|nr:WD40-repeat-containing domain protein [Radiomyces spectabilis]KAI8371379.1 WD40-repeat-containing domain protein [Radiomyces spectabilis]
MDIDPASHADADPSTVITEQTTVIQTTMSALSDTQTTTVTATVTDALIEQQVDPAAATDEVGESLADPTMTVGVAMETEAVEITEASAPSGFSMFIHDVAQPCTLVASTGDRYNTTVQQSLSNEVHLIQQRASPSNVHEANNFFRNAKWSPDGTCLLTNSEDDVVRLFNMPPGLYGSPSEDIEPLEPILGIRGGETIYDFAWFPSMSIHDPATCCFLTSVRDHPVRLWDVTTGEIRASYCVIDHRERFIGPNVVAFNLDGSKIYCGYENMIEVFDVQREGQESTKLPTIPSRRSKQGQKGIISCLDFSPDYGGLYACGSYSQSIGIYDETNNELCLKLTGMQGGVTQVKFSPDGSLLFSASRQSDAILCWDIRNTANILYELPRPGKTNQRITFDIAASGKVLVTGDQDGHIRFYDLEIGASEEEDDETRPRLLRSFDGHQDITSCVTFNPVYPYIASTSGQRKFTVPEESSSDDSDDEDGQMSDMQQDVVIDNTLKIWQVQGQYAWYPYETDTFVEEETVTAEA